MRGLELKPGNIFHLGGTPQSAPLLVKGYPHRKTGLFTAINLLTKEETQHNAKDLSSVELGQTVTYILENYDYDTYAATFNGVNIDLNEHQQALLRDLGEEWEFIFQTQTDDLSAEFLEINDTRYLLQFFINNKNNEFVF